MSEIIQAPTRVDLYGVAGEPFSVTVQLEDSDSDPLTGVSAVVVSVWRDGAKVSALAADVANTDTGVYVASWSEDQTATIGTDGRCSYSFECELSSDGPYAIVAGTLRAASPNVPGASTSTTLPVQVTIGSDTVQVAVDLGTTGGGSTTVTSPDGTITVTGGDEIDVVYGTMSDTAAEGNDSRIAGAAQKSANLGDLASASTARMNLGLGTAATQASSAFDAAGSAATAQGNAETYAASQAATAQSNAETYAAAQAAAAQAAAEAASDPAGSAATAQSNAETFATSAVATETARAEAAEALLAPKASPALTGSPTAPTQTTGDASTKLATDQFVATAVGVETTRAEAAEATLLPLAGGTMSGAIAMGSHKVTGLTNGSSAQDAAAFGQIPTALPPNGAAGGSFTGSYPNPTIATIPSGATGTTQSALDSSTKIGTTAYADSAVGVENARALAAEALLAPIRVLSQAPQSGDYVIPQFYPFAVTTIAAVLNRMRFALLWLPQGTYDGLAIRVGTGVATAVIRLGLFNPDTARGLPGTLVVDGGTVAATSSNAYQVQTVSTFTWPGGLVWAAAAAQTAAVGYYGFNGSLGIGAAGVVYSDTTVFGNNSNNWYAAGISGALSSNPTLTYVGNDAINAPSIGVRKH